MSTYSVKQATDLSEAEIQTILLAWDVDAWKQMSHEDFMDRFRHSEFHLLKDPEAKLLSIARINYQFKVMVNEKEYDIGELVGLVSVEILKGHGKLLLSNIANNLAGRQIEAIGFCEKRNAAFYESAGFRVLLDKVKHLRERKDDQWFTPSEDDHIVAIALNDQTLQVFEQISDENPAYLYF